MTFLAILPVLSKRPAPSRHRFRTAKSWGGEVKYELRTKDPPSYSTMRIPQPGMAALVHAREWGTSSPGSKPKGLGLLPAEGRARLFQGSKERGRLGSHATLSSGRKGRPLTRSFRPKMVTLPLICSFRRRHSMELRPFSMGREMLQRPMVGVMVPARTWGSLWKLTPMPLAYITLRVPLLQSW